MIVVGCARSLQSSHSLSHRPLFHSRFVAFSLQIFALFSLLIACVQSSSLREDRNARRRAQYALDRSQAITPVRAESDAPNSALAGTYTAQGEYAVPAWEGCATPDQLQDFERNPLTMQRCFWTLSGQGSLKPASAEDLSDHIGQPLTAAEEYDLLKRATDASNPWRRIVGCASCGVRAVGSEDSDYFRVPVVDPRIATAFAASPDMLALEASLRPLTGNTGLNATDLSALVSVYRHPSSPSLPPLMLWKRYIHDDKVTLCRPCYNCLTKPRPQPSKFSLAAGVNFGDTEAFNLPKLTFAEQLLISRYRVMQTMIKIVPVDDTVASGTPFPTLKGHIVTELQDGVEAFAASLPHLDLSSRLAVWFVGTRTQFANMRDNGTFRTFMKTVLEVRVFFL
jgi:hypothetical protein